MEELNDANLYWFIGSINTTKSGSVSGFKWSKFDQNQARSLSKEKNLNLICGHFEGVDQRLLETRNIEEYSLGDFVLSGGEPASFELYDALVRLLMTLIHYWRCLPI